MVIEFMDGFKVPQPKIFSDLEQLINDLLNMTTTLTAELFINDILNRTTTSTDDNTQPPTTASSINNSQRLPSATTTIHVPQGR